MYFLASACACATRMHVYIYFARAMCNVINECSCTGCAHKRCGGVPMRYHSRIERQLYFHQVCVTWTLRIEGKRVDASGQ
eukprot:scaffold3942_cov123-Isochrysis_galbana.AAC.9